MPKHQPPRASSQGVSVTLTEFQGKDVKIGKTLWQNRGGHIEIWGRTR
jgi:hypothetical protein